MPELVGGAGARSDDAVALTPVESVPLLTTWVTRLAEDAGIRALVIKGPLAAVQGLRRQRESGDVDVWVDPAAIDNYVDLLREHGWYAPVNDRPSILPVHALTMRHPRWACELDVHDRFPGFFADRQDVFDRLWELRSTELLAGAPVLTPSRAGSAVVLGLHLLRDLRPGRPNDELDHLVAAVREFTAAEQDIVRQLVAACGANETMAPFLEQAGLVPLPGPAAAPEDLADWRLLTTTHGAPTVYWLHRLGRTPVRQWPGFLWRAFWMTDDQIKVSEPAADSSRGGMLRARLRRLRRGLAMLPKAVRLVLSSRKGPSARG